MQEIKLSGQSLTRLFESVGREPGLEKILIRFYDKMSKDLMIGFFFDGRDVHAIALKQKNFLMRAWGAASSYEGRSPAAAHASLPSILKGHFDRRLILLEETLHEFNVAKKEIATWVEFEKKFRQAVQHS